MRAQIASVDAPAQHPARQEGLAHVGWPSPSRFIPSSTGASVQALA
jgi:hypothetical protein